MHFRREMCAKILQEMEGSGFEATAKELSKKITLLSTLCFVDKAWKSVKESRIRNCWIKGGLQDNDKDKDSDEDKDTDKDIDQGLLCLKPQQWADYVSIHNSLITSSEKSDEDIVQEVLGEMSTSSKVQIVEESDEEEEQPCPTNKEMLAAVKGLEITFDKERKPPFCASNQNWGAKGCSQEYEASYDKEVICCWGKLDT